MGQALILLIGIEQVHTSGVQFKFKESPFYTLHFLCAPTDLGIFGTGVPFFRTPGIGIAMSDCRLVCQV